MDWMVSREGWRARTPRQMTPLNPATLSGVALHYSSMQAERRMHHDGCDDVVRNIQAYHIDHNEWSDIAYSWLVCWHGVCYQGRGWGVRTAANGTKLANTRFHAVCFLGGDDTSRDDVTSAGRRALAAIIADGLLRYPRARQIRPHSSFKATSCPGDELRQWVYAGLPVTGPPTPTPTVPHPPGKDDMPISDSDIERIREEAVIKPLKDKTHYYLESQFSRVRETLEQKKIRETLEREHAAEWADMQEALVKIQQTLADMRAERRHESKETQ